MSDPSPPTSDPEDVALTVTLSVTGGPHAGRVFTFDRHDTFLVGRSPDVHFYLPDDPYFSRVHFMVEVCPPLCRVLDLKSRNHTLVNGAEVQSATLKDGDEIRAGDTVLKVSIQQPQATPSTRFSLTQPGQPAPDPAAAVTEIPGYRLVRELGRGGMGVVYLAEKEGAAAPVALKCIRPAITPTPRTAARFLREVEILRKLSHPHIVAFHEMGEAGGVLYFAMEYVDGTTAWKWARVEKPLAVKRAVGLVCQMLEALAHAHTLGFVHRDVKPANVLVSRVADMDYCKLADFGLARAYQSSTLSGLTTSESAGGTPGFMPPEQVLDFRSAKPAADQYGAAATLYYLLSGQSVQGHHDSLDEFFHHVLTMEPVPLEQHRQDLPSGLPAAVHRALARAPENRFADVTAFRAALLPFATD